MGPVLTADGGTIVGGATPASIKAVGSIVINGAFVVNKTITIQSSDGTSKGYLAKDVEDLTADPPHFDRNAGTLSLIHI